MDNGSLEISTVVGCKMMCSYCPQKAHVFTYTERSDVFAMSLTNFIKYIASVPKQVGIVFAGMAEPFLNKEATKMVLHAHERGYRISIFTTGLGLKYFDSLILSGLEYNHFCLHLPDEEGDMNINITDEYLGVVKNLIPIATNIMCIGRLHPKLRESTGRDISGKKENLYSRAGNLLNFPYHRKSGHIYCSSCSGSLNHNVLLPNGDIVICCMDYNQDHVLGNLNDIEYNTIFASNEYKRVIKGLEDETINILCRKCEVVKNK